MESESTVSDHLAETKHKTEDVDFENPGYITSPPSFNEEKGTVRLEGVRPDGKHSGLTRLKTQKIGLIGMIWFVFWNQKNFHGMLIRLQEKISSMNQYH